MTTIDSLTECPHLLDDDTTARIALACAGVAGDASVSIAIDAAGGASRFVAAVHDRNDQALPLSNLTRARIRTLATGRTVARALQLTHALGQVVVTPIHEAWPRQLEALSHRAPLVLWVGGSVAHLARPSVAMTGTSNPTEFGIRKAHELGIVLAQRGWVIATGSGKGLASHALEAALAMGGGVLEVTAANTADRHRNARVTVVSEVAPAGAATIRSQRRAKQLLAALSAKTIIVEAGRTASVLGAAEAAYSMGRPVGIVATYSASSFSQACAEFAARPGVRLLAGAYDALRLE